MGTALSISIDDHYELRGVLDVEGDDQDPIPIYADADMSEVDMFDYSFVYGLGYEHHTCRMNLIVEYRFTSSWNTLQMPTYAHIDTFEGQHTEENLPVPLKNQTHSLMLGVRF
jgi:hypothetical protein